MAEEKKTKTVSVGDVLAKDKAPKAESKASPSKTATKKKHRHTHIEHHDDGSHTVRHTPMGGGEEVSYAAPDLDAVHDGLEQHVGDENADEGMSQAQPSPASSPMAQPQPQQPGA
jgi:hypothetical protein